MSYTPVGLFNHTAAIYQMLTGYTADKVSPSGQLEPPSPKDFPNFGCNIVKLKPLAEPMLPYVMMPRPLQESNVIGKGGTAGFLGKAFDPYTLFPGGGDLDLQKMEKIKVDDLELRSEIPASRLVRRPYPSSAPAWPSPDWSRIAPARDSRRRLPPQRASRRSASAGSRNCSDRTARCSST